MPKDITITVSDEQESVLLSVMTAENTKIDAENRRIQAEKDLAAANGTEYRGGLVPRPMLTFEMMVQSRFNERMSQDLRDRSRKVADDLTATFMAADASTQAAMMADLAKYRSKDAPK